MTTATTPTIKPMIRAEDVCKSYGQLEVLRSINLSVQRGEVLCLIGRSGSGKTTFLRCINHLERIDSGRLWVGDDLVGYRVRNGRLHELKDREVCAQRARIGMVFQRFNLFPHMTALENVMAGPVRVKGLKRAKVIDNARELMARVGLSDKEKSYPSQLSGGQQQRIAIARSLAMEPELMLFDEPTSALDPELVGEVLDVMQALAEDGMTMVIVTHEMSFARDVANQVAFVHEGRIEEAGPPAQVIGDPASPLTRRFLSNVGLAVRG